MKRVPERQGLRDRKQWWCEILKLSRVPSQWLVPAEIQEKLFKPVSQPEIHEGGSMIVQCAVI